MPDPTNAEVAAAFDELADLYELDGAVIHRVLAYRTAAKTVREASASVATLTREGRVTSLDGIGKTLEEKITALLQTGTIPATEKLRAKYPPGLLDLKRLPGLGPKRARLVFSELGIDSLAALGEAAAAGRLKGVKGLGPKFEASVLAALEAGAGEHAAARILLPRALETGEALRDALRAHPAAVEVELAGGARRLADSVKDLDLVASSEDPAALSAALADVDLVESASSPGENAARGRTHSGMAIDLRVVEPASWGNLLQHFTGSKAHNVELRPQTVRRGLHVSEYGILDDTTGETTRCATEEEVYARLGLAWIPPELREGRGELDAARDGGAGLPRRLVEQADLRGDLHMHTTASDGRNSIEQMAVAARERGLTYIAITDHSATHGFGNHVTAEELERHMEAVREVDARLEGITVLAGTEVNVLPDGSPDYPDELLARLDWVIGSVHTAFNQAPDALTARMVAACEHSWIDCLGHPTGRKIESRAPYPVDVHALIAAAARTGTMLEINAAPDRRDLNELHARAAHTAGVRIVVNSDAHGANTLRNTRWGIATARRAWLEAGDVANCRDWADFAPLRKRARRAGAA